MRLRTLSELVGEIKPHERDEIAATKDRSAVESLAFNLAELREARKMAQIELSYMFDRLRVATPHTTQPNHDRLSALQGIIEKLGGSLELVAVFEDERIPIDIVPEAMPTPIHDRGEAPATLS